MIVIDGISAEDPQTNMSINWLLKSAIRMSVQYGRRFLDPYLKKNPKYRLHQIQDLHDRLYKIIESKDNWSPDLKADLKNIADIVCVLGDCDNAYFQFMREVILEVKKSEEWK